jgi:hypothetical protein
MCELSMLCGVVESCLAEAFLNVKEAVYCSFGFWKQRFCKFDFTTEKCNTASVQQCWLDTVTEVWQPSRVIVILEALAQMLLINVCSQP